LADWTQNEIDFCFLEQFDCGRSLPRNHIFVFEWVDHSGTRCRNDLSTSNVPRGFVRLTENNFASVTFYPADFHFGRIRGHNNVRRNSPEPGRARHGLGVITG